MKNMTKDRYNTIGERLLIITLLSTFVCLFVNSYIPLIITSAVFVGFLIFARKRYGYRAVEFRTLRDDEKKYTNDTVNGCYNSYNNPNDPNNPIYSPAYSHLRCNIYHSKND